MEEFDFKIGKNRFRIEGETKAFWVKNGNDWSLFVEVNKNQFQVAALTEISAEKEYLNLMPFPVFKLTIERNDWEGYLKYLQDRDVKRILLNKFNEK